MATKVMMLLFLSTLVVDVVVSQTETLFQYVYRSSGVCSITDRVGRLQGKSASDCPRPLRCFPSVTANTSYTFGCPLSSNVIPVPDVNRGDLYAESTCNVR